MPCSILQLACVQCRHVECVALPSENFTAVQIRVFFFRLKDNEKKSKMQRTMLQLKEITLRSVSETKVYADVRKTDLIFIAAPLLRLPKSLC